MAKFVLAYSGGEGGMPESEEEMNQVMAQWGAWFETLGASVIDGGNPFGASKTVSPGGGVGDGPAMALTGYSVIDASDLDDAAAKAQGCPVLGNGGSVTVLEAIDM